MKISKKKKTSEAICGTLGTSTNKQNTKSHLTRGVFVMEDREVPGGRKKRTDDTQTNTGRFHECS